MRYWAIHRKLSVCGHKSICVFPPVIMRRNHPEIYFALEIVRNMPLVQTAFTFIEPGYKSVISHMLRIFSVFC